MTYAEFFEKVKGLFMEADVSDITEHLAYQFNIVGESEGIFYVEVKDGKLSVEPYEYYDRDAIFIASAETFMKIAQGKLDPIVAFTVHKLKVEGNIDKALKLKTLIDSKR
jgi:putative sterol carrier protein